MILDFYILIYVSIIFIISFDDHTIFNKKTETVSGLIFENNERLFV